MLYVKMLVILCSIGLMLVGCGKTEAVPMQIAETYPATVSTEEPPVEVMEVTEPEKEGYIPSNWSDYDKQWLLGCETMGWKFGEWMFKMGAVDVTPQGMKLTHLSMDFPAFSGLTVETERYLEIWDGNTWQALSQFAGTGGTVFEGSQEPGKEVMLQEIWDAPLAPGYYRLGAYYTATMDSGDEYRQMCYAKFRIVDADTDDLVKQCREGLKALLEKDSFHIVRTDYMLQQRDREDPHYFTQETFKSGEDYYKDYRYYFYADHSEKGAQAELYRNGKGQNWNSSEDASRNWKPADFVTSEDFSMEGFGLECEPDILGTISKDGNTITILTPQESYSPHQEIRETELTYRFDDAGNVTEIRLDYLFADGEKETEIKLEVKATAEEEIRKIIDSQ